jgi:hypothetical protein
MPSLWEQKGLVGKRESYECKKSRKCQCLHANIVMQGSQLPFCYRFISTYLLTGTKKSFPAFELKRQLGYECYGE